MTKNSRVLAADHEESSLEELASTLKDYGYEYVLCRNGQDVLEQFNTFKPAVCIIDPILPGVDGFSVCQKITESTKTPVIINTGIYKGDRYQRDARVKYGASLYLEKPYPKKKLIEALESLGVSAPLNPSDDDQDQTLKDNLDDSVSRDLFAGSRPAPPKVSLQGSTMRVSPEDLKREMEKVKDEMTSKKFKIGSKDDEVDGGVLTSNDIFGDLIDSMGDEPKPMPPKENWAAKPKVVKDVPIPAPLPPPPSEDSFELPSVDSFELPDVSADTFQTQPMPTIPNLPNPKKAAPVAKPGDSNNVGNDYQLLEKIAAGGMAEVWKAKLVGQKGFEKIVAIKKILPHLSANEEFLTMFTDEAKVAAKLTHPNIAQIYELKAGNPAFIAMEYVAGYTVRAIITQSRSLGVKLAPDIVAFIGMKLCNALHYAHNKKDFDNEPLNIVHRDVSPQNIILSHDGEVKLVDFGIAKASIKATETVAGSLKGKLLYMSPEQGEGQQLDHRSDIFSLANVMYEALTNTKLFSGNSELAILNNVRSATFVAPRELNPFIPEALAKVMAKAMTKDREDRYASARDFEAALKDYFVQRNSHLTESEVAEYLRLLFNNERSKLETFIKETEPLPPPAVLVESPVEKPAVILPDKEEMEDDFMGSNISSNQDKKGPMIMVAIFVLLLILVGAWWFSSKKEPTPPVNNQPMSTQETAPQPSPAAATTPDLPATETTAPPTDNTATATEKPPVIDPNKVTADEEDAELKRLEDEFRKKQERLKELKEKNKKDQ